MGNRQSSGPAVMPVPPDHIPDQADNRTREGSSRVVRLSREELLHRVPLEQNPESTEYVLENDNYYNVRKIASAHYENMPENEYENVPRGGGSEYYNTHHGRGGVTPYVPPRNCSTLPRETPAYANLGEVRRSLRSTNSRESSDIVPANAPVPAGRTSIRGKSAACASASPDSSSQSSAERGTIIYHPGDLQGILRESRELAERQKLSRAVVHERLRKNCEVATLVFRKETPGVGDCFFDAVSDQLDRLGLSPMTARQLRTDVVTFLMENKSFQGRDGEIRLDLYTDWPSWEDYIFEMARDGVYADHVIVVGMARMLNRDIMVLTSSPDGGLENNITWVVGKDCFDGEPILLGHYWENHYQSLDTSGRDRKSRVLCTRDGHALVDSSSGLRVYYSPDQ